jgi:glycosyltransferase involved in cell wall biosynthesis
MDARLSHAFDHLLRAENIESQIRQAKLTRRRHKNQKARWQTSMKKLRILHVIPNFGNGGAERLVVDLLQATDKDRFEVAAVSLYSESGSQRENEIKAKGIKAFYLNKHLGLDLRIMPQLYRLFQDFRPDIVHTHRYAMRYTLLAAFFSKVPIQVHTVHSIAQKEVDWIGKLVHRIAFQSGAVLPVSISQAVANTVQAVYGSNIHSPVIYNGISTSRFYSHRKHDNKKSETDIVLLHIGRFAPEKNHLLLIESFALAVKDYPNMQLWLIGDGLLRPAMERLVNEKCLSSAILFFGALPDVKDYLADCDLFILSSDWEGFGIVVAEAMAAGKPTIATCVDGVPELVVDGVTGILVPPQNPQALAQGILHLAKNPDLRQRMGKAAEEQARERFDISRTAKEYESLYLKLSREREMI